MKSFQEFLVEEGGFVDLIGVTLDPKEQESLFVDKVAKVKSLIDAGQYKSSPLVIRGFRAKQLLVYNNALLEVSSRSNFQGKESGMSSAVKSIITHLKIENPVFASKSVDSTAYFGKPFILVPASTFTCFWSKEIVDLKRFENEINKEYSVNNNAIAKKILSVVDGYETVKNNIPNTENEIIFECKSYFLLWLDLLNTLPKFKKQKLRNFKDIENYSDLSKELSKIISLIK